MLRAEFLAVAQVIVYAGAIVVLFVFAIMVLIPGRRRPGPTRSARSAGSPCRWSAARLLEIALVLGSTRLAGAAARAVRAAAGWSRSDGCSSPTTCFPFEVTSVLLLAGVVGVMAADARDGAS